MNSHLENIRESSIPLPITNAALRLAEKFANLEGVTDPEKQEQVYFNTLAVCAVKDYLEMMDIPTDLNASDSWNPAMRLYTDAADLKLTELGHLECRPLKLGKFYDLLLDVPDDRIGLVAVEIDTNRQEATLVGFLKTTAFSGDFAVDKLQSIDKLLEHLDCLERQKKPVQLRQWLHNIFEAGWQAVEDILVPQEPSLAFRYRNAVVRGKIINLTADISEPASATSDCFRAKPNLWRSLSEPAQAVALVVAIAPTTDTETKIKVQVHPAARADSLPLNLTLKVIDGEGTTVMEATAGKGNGCMTLEFAADRGEYFSVVVKLKELCILENFAA